MCAADLKTSGKSDSSLGKIVKKEKLMLDFLLHKTGMQPHV